MKHKKHGMLPDFTSEGVLPVGEYELTLSELRTSILVAGSDYTSQNWDNDWRGKLIDNLEVMVRHLWEVGITEIFIDGSFVENKDHPGDIDGYFICDEHELRTRQLQTKLNALDINKIWDWSNSARWAPRGSPKKQLRMWHIYRVELYPHYPGMMCGICDERGHQLEFPSAFRQTRGNYLPKGIVKLRKGDDNDQK